MTTTEKLRAVLTDGTIATARDFAAMIDAEVDTVSSVLSRMEKHGLAAVADYDWAPSGHKVKVYQATAKTSTGTLPGFTPRPPGEKNIRTDGLTGLRGIVLAVIADAAKDAKRGDREAREWFESRAYEFYMDWLGLNPEMRPLFMERSA
jgi:hypothetical protein